MGCYIRQVTFTEFPILSEFNKDLSSPMRELQGPHRSLEIGDVQVCPENELLGCP